MKSVEDALAELNRAVARAVMQISLALTQDDKTPPKNEAAFKAEGSQLILDETARFVVFGDLNRFKNLNDRHGHAAGDAAISRAGVLLLEIADAVGGAAYRKSGDEFVLIVPERQRSTFEALARERFSSFTFSHGDDTHQSAMSFGIASSGDALLDELRRRAERACQAAKTKGDGEVLEWSEDLDRQDAVDQRFRCGACGAKGSCSVPIGRPAGALHCPVCTSTLTS